MDNQKLLEELDAANEKCLRLRADCERFARVNDSLIVENEALKKKLEQADAPRRGIIYKLQTEANQLKAENDLFREECGKLTSDNASLQAQLRQAEKVWRAESEGLKAERDQLRAQVKRDERIYNTIMDLLEQDGYDTMSLFFNTGYIVAQMELEEEHDRR